MPDRNVMGLFDEDLDAANNDDVTWLEATLRSSIEPQDWPYWGTRLIKRIRSHELLVRDLLAAMHEAATASHEIGSRGEHYGNCEGCQRDKRRDALLEALRLATPTDVQASDELEADVAEMKDALERDEIDPESLRTAKVSGWPEPAAGELEEE